jgi:hypothetical protein
MQTRNMKWFRASLLSDADIEKATRARAAFSIGNSSYGTRKNTPSRVRRQANSGRAAR